MLKPVARGLAPLMLFACAPLGGSGAGPGGMGLASKDDQPGHAVYAQHCASCHDHPTETRSPSLDTLRALGFRAVQLALSDGPMRPQSALLTDEERIAVTGWLDAAAGDADNSWIEAHRCEGARRGVDLSGTPTVVRFGIDERNRRSMTAEQAGLTAGDLGDLELAWALGFPGNVSLRSQPAIVGTQMFYSTPESGQLFALDIAGEPCVEWVYQPGVPLRSSVTYGELPGGRKVIAFSDTAAQEHMLDATTGEELWTTHVALGLMSNTTGAPVLLGDRVYAPVSASELNYGANPDYECCRTHGGVVALEAATGAKIWEFHTMKDAEPTRVSRVGTQLWGPSGAPIWTTPAIDEARGQLYVGTGENTSTPATDTSDSVMAIALEDGALRWKFQGSANDIFLTGCMADNTGPNCPPPDSINADYDFGASIMLAQRSDGSDIVLAGQKSGMLWALDPDDGALLWSVDLGPGGPAGGIHWGIATDGTRVFAGVNRVSAPGEDLSRPPSLSAVDIDTGEVVWTRVVEPDCDGDRRARMPGCDQTFGFSAAPMVIDGAVVQGGLDGLVRIVDGATGDLIWSTDTARPYETVNGVPARGGSIDNAAVVAANGMLFVNSGYGLAAEQAGNVLLAFKPK